LPFRSTCWRGFDCTSSAGRDDGCDRRIGEAPATRRSRGSSPAEWADLVAAIYERIVVRGEDLASVHLTPSAHGLALELPERL
jgi:hypothetical protein